MTHDFMFLANLIKEVKMNENEKGKFISRLAIHLIAKNPHGFNAEQFYKTAVGLRHKEVKIMKAQCMYDYENHKYHYLSSNGRTHLSWCVIDDSVEVTIATRRRNGMWIDGIETSEDVCCDYDHKIVADFFRQLCNLLEDEIHEIAVWGLGDEVSKSED